MQLQDKKYKIFFFEYLFLSYSLSLSFLSSVQTSMQLYDLGPGAQICFYPAIQLLLLPTVTDICIDSHIKYADWDIV